MMGKSRKEMSEILLGRDTTQQAPSVCPFQTLSLTQPQPHQLGPGENASSKWGRLSSP